jgi:hypothetical protein
MMDNNKLQLWMIDDNAIVEKVKNDIKWKDWELVNLVF